MSNVTRLTGSNNSEYATPLPFLQKSEPVSAPAASLGGFDLVWAITPQAVNLQLAKMQQAGLIPDRIMVGDLDEAGLVLGGEGEDRAMIGPPTLSFDTGIPRTARLQLTLTGGNMVFYNGFGNKSSILKQSVKGWKLALIVKVHLIPVLLKDLIDGKIAALPENVNRLSRFNEDEYRIQAAMLDFEHSDLMRTDAEHTYLPTDNSFLSSNFINFIGAWLKGMAGAANPFALGYPVTRKAPADDTVESLQASGANLAAYRTLNFLMVTGRRKIAHEPRLYGADAGHFERPLPAGAGCAGKAILARDVFFKQFLKPLLIDPLQQKFNALPDYLHSRIDQNGERDPEETQNEKSGAVATLSNGARALFVPNATGWHYRDHVLLHWHEGSSHAHDRESEQDVQFSVVVSTLPDGAGVPRLTVDLTSSMMRYEWDRVNQKLAPFKRKIYMGKGWARATLQCSLRLQFVPGAQGGIALKVCAKKAPPVTDSGVMGMYVVSDAFAHLMNINKISNDWDSNAVSLAVLQDGLVAELGAAAATLFERAAAQLVMPAGSPLRYRGIRLNADGDVELDVAFEER